MERGLTQIQWTFDPLIARNAYLNIHRLGARPTAYLVDFYGAMDDGFNTGQPSDRMMLHWALSERDEPPLTGAVGRQPVLVLAEDSLALPREQLDHLTGGLEEARQCHVKIPSDIALMRETDAPLALRWRESLRRVLGTLMAEEWQITDFDRTGFYVLERK